MGTRIMSGRSARSVRKQEQAWEPLFVIGSPRSGTTFLMRVFQALPQTVCISGVVYPPTLPQLLPHVTGDTRQHLVSALRQAIQHYLDSPMFLSRTANWQKWWASSRNIRGAMRALNGHRGFDTVVFKEPFLSFAPETIAEAFPGARVIHIVRDGRDSADSMVRRYNILTDEYLEGRDNVETAISRMWNGRRLPGWVPDGAETRFLDSSQFLRCVMMWEAMVSSCHSFVSSGSCPTLEIRYEDLMQSPRSVFREVASFGGMEDLGRSARVLDRAHNQSVGIHRGRSGEEVAAATETGRAMLEAYGYV
jgi:Sulfotransferase family